jgi:hypothetical protein
VSIRMVGESITVRSFNMCREVQNGSMSALTRSDNHHNNHHISLHLSRSYSLEEEDHPYRSPSVEEAGRSYCPELCRRRKGDRFPAVNYHGRCPSM